jgi:hypothetical protein
VPVDMRDLGQVFDHDGPLPHPSAEQLEVN